MRMTDCLARQHGFMPQTSGGSRVPGNLDVALSAAARQFLGLSPSGTCDRTEFCYDMFTF